MSLQFSARKQDAEAVGGLPVREADYWTQLAWITSGASPLAAWRHAARLSHRELGELSGIAAEELIALEARKRAPTAEEISNLAKALGLCPGDLED